MRLDRKIQFVILLFSLFLLLSVPAAPVQAAVGTISISPSSGPVATTVSVSGSGFTAASTYTVRFAGSTVAVGTIGAGGTLAATFNVPAFPRGTYSVSVTTSAPDTSNTVSYTVVPSISSDITIGNVGDEISISGSGFAASTTVDVYFDNSNQGSVFTNTNGSFFAFSLAVPVTYRGSHTISATDGIYAPSLIFTVLPEITLEPTPQQVGDETDISGTGFARNSTIALYLNSTLMSGVTAATNTNGSFSIQNFSIPKLSRGSHTVRVRDLSFNEATASFSIRQSVSLSPQSGSSGDVIAVNGNGFLASRAVTINFGTLNVSDITPAIIRTDSGGSFIAQFTVGNSPGAGYSISVSDGIYTASTAFNVSGRATLTPAGGPPGSTVEISGLNFRAGDNIVIRYDGQLVAQAAASGQGMFQATFTVPNGPAGEHTVTAADSLTTATLLFMVRPNAVLSQGIGSVGGDITVNGTGFLAGRVVNISLGNVFLSSVTTNGNGSFSATFTIPDGATGPHTVNITDGLNQVSQTLSIIAGAVINPSSGPVASEVTITGKGFAASRVITLDFDGGRVATGTSNANGSFSTTFAVPGGVGGRHTITATDGTSTVNLSFDVTPALVMNPASGFVGGIVTVTGTGFTAGRTVTIRYDSTQVATATTDVNGAFSRMFAAPASRGGDHTVTANDGVSVVSAVFKMDSSAPPAPVLISPPEGSRQGSLPTLRWSPVTDPSGVSYGLEISSDSSFQNLVLEKSGLTTDRYTLAQPEKLPSEGKDSPYYWRVMATDNASNQSPWSTPQSFYVGFTLSDWGLYAVFGLGALIVGVIAFLLGRISRKPKPAKS